MATIESELGRPWTEIYAQLSPEPVAAASLGQVYRGRLKSGEEVAVKVQRPYVLETVTVDLYIIRYVEERGVQCLLFGIEKGGVDDPLHFQLYNQSNNIPVLFPHPFFLPFILLHVLLHIQHRNVGLALRQFPQIKTDVVALLDEWAARFFEELDYVREGRNATIFAEQMKDDLPQVVVPKTYEDYTSRRVLTIEWLEGEKLSQSKADDVGTLVNVGVICYLKQLLDTGFFHADPHPGVCDSVFLFVMMWCGI